MTLGFYWGRWQDGVLVADYEAEWETPDTSKETEPKALEMAPATVKTVGDLRELLADMPDDTPLVSWYPMGECDDIRNFVN